LWEGPQTPAVVVPARLAERLRARHAEIEEALRARVYAISDPGEAVDPEYTAGLRTAIEEALDYGLAGIEAAAEHLPPIPPTLLAQARIAARNEINLDTVLRRYFGGYALLGDFLIDAAHAEEMSGPVLKRLLRTQATLFDRLIAAVSEEYGRERETRASSAAERRLACVKRLLNGEFVDPSELNYDLEASHLAAIVKGPEAISALDGLAAILDRRLLAVQSDDVTIWAWFGGRHKLQPDEIERAISRHWPERLPLTIGEPAQGLAGWRFTHRQARAALPVAAHTPKAFTRYADVALLASMLQDDLLTTSLRQIYLAPLLEDCDRGAVHRESLRAYLDANCNVSSAAAALGVNRHTVTSHLRIIEERLGRPLNTCTAEVDAALRLEALDSPLLPYASIF